MAPNPILNANGDEEPKFFTANKVEFKFGWIQAQLPFFFFLVSLNLSFKNPNYNLDFHKKKAKLELDLVGYVQLSSSLTALLANEPKIN